MRVATYGCNPTLPASTPATTPTLRARPTWTATADRQRHGGHWRLRVPRTRLDDFLRLVAAIRSAYRRLADAADPDADGHTTWEWRCLNQPYQRALGVAPVDPESDSTNVDVDLAERGRGELFPGAEHEPVGNRPFTLRATNLPGQPGTTRFTDTNAAPLSPSFYRVGVNCRDEQ